MAEAPWKRPGAWILIGAEGATEPVVEIADTSFLLGAQRAAAEGSCLEIALGDLADSEILAHNLAIVCEGALPGSAGFLAAVREIEVIDQPRALPVDRQDARCVHPVGI